jgi:hypothetical protein
LRDAEQFPALLNPDSKFFRIHFGNDRLYYTTLPAQTRGEFTIF